MAVEVAEQMMDVLGGNRVAVPFFDVVGQQTLVRVLLGFLVEVLQMVLEVVDELVV